MSAGHVGLSTFGQLSSADAHDILRVVAGGVTLAGAALAFARLQVSLARGQDRPHLPLVILLLGLLPSTWAAPGSGLAYGFAAALISFSAMASTGLLLAAGGIFAALYQGGGDVTNIDLAAALVEIVLAALVFTTVTHLAVLLNRLHRARELLARRRVDHERERVGRDLHDLMGRTLVTASLRNQKILRMPGLADPRLRSELENLQAIIVAGEERVRSITAGNAIASWPDEVETARMLCNRVGIDLTVEVSGEPLQEHRPIIGLAIRDMVTAALGQVHVSRLDLTVHGQRELTTLVIISDAIATAIRQAGRCGRLRRAVEVAGGHITEDVIHGMLRLTVTLPGRAAATSPAAPGGRPA